MSLQKIFLRFAVPRYTSALLSFCVPSFPYRFISSSSSSLPITSSSSPSKFIPPAGDFSVESFLKKIGRGCFDSVQHIKTWDQLFLLDGNGLKSLGIKVKQRRWILRWVEHYRQGVLPITISLSDSKARKNNPGMEKRRRQKYPGWAEYMFPDREEHLKMVSKRVEELASIKDKGRRAGLL